MNERGLGARGKVLEEVLDNLDYWRDDWGITRERLRLMVLTIGTGIFRELNNYNDCDIIEIISVDMGEAKSRHKADALNNTGRPRLDWFGKKED